MSEERRDVASWSGAIRLIETTDKATARAVANQCVQRQYYNINNVRRVEFAVSANLNISSVDRLAIIYDMRRLHKKVIIEAERLDDTESRVHELFETFQTTEDPYFRAQTLLVIRDGLNDLALEHYSHGKIRYDNLKDTYRRLRNVTYAQISQDHFTPQELRIQPS